MYFLRRYSLALAALLTLSACTGPQNNETATASSQPESTSLAKVDASGSVSVPGTILAVDMSGKPASGGPQTEGGVTVYNIYYDGALSNAFIFPSKNKYRITVNARGDLAGGVGPTMEIRLDGKVLRTVVVNSSTLTNYTVDASVTPGSHTIAIAYKNDAVINGKDRNLIVRSVNVAAVAATTPAPAPAPAPTPTPTPSPTPAPSTSVADVPSTVAAKDMTTKTVGGLDDSGAWNVWGNGLVSHTFNFKTAGTYKFTVNAFGSSAGGTWPTMEIRLDGTVISTTTVGSATLANYEAATTVSAGNHVVAIAFTNDTATSTEDRNLYVNSVSVAAGSVVVTPAPLPIPPPVVVIPVPDNTTTPTPAPTNGIAYPFGSHKYAYTGNYIKPAATQDAMDATVKSVYDKWKAGFIKKGCGTNTWYVAGGQSGYLAVSEGQGYGMLATVLMAGYDADARTIFDGIYRFARSKGSVSHPYLMAWEINMDCSIAGAYPAADGDMDIAMALLMADVQWGSNTGSINYLEEAKKTIAAIKQVFVKNGTVDYIASGPSVDIMRSSDVMPTHFRAYKKATGDAIWDTVLARSFSVLDLMQTKFAANTGLMPDVVVSTNTSSPTPSPGMRLESNIEQYYSYNACRNPWRLANDYIVSGDARSKNMTQKIINFFKSSTGGDPSKIYSVYTLAGQAQYQYNDLSFQAPIGLGAIVDSSNQAFLNTMWTYLAGKTGGYYDGAIQLLSMIVISGNWFQP